MLNGIRKITWIKITQRERVEKPGFYMDSFFTLLSLISVEINIYLELPGFVTF